MGYNAGFVKYVVMGPFTNPVAFYIYGVGLLALLNAVPHFVQGQFIEMVIEYFLTKYLPPTSVGQIVVQVVFGSVGAGIKWFVFTLRT